MKKCLLMVIAVFTLIAGVVLSGVKSDMLIAGDDGIIEWNSIGGQELII